MISRSGFGIDNPADPQKLILLLYFNN